MSSSAMLVPIGEHSAPFGATLMKSAVVNQVATALGIELPTFLELVGIPSRTFTRRVRGDLTELEADRVSRVKRVWAEAVRVFGSPQKARSWLQTPNQYLGAQPVVLLGTDAGAAAVSEELAKIAWGDLA